MLPSDHFGSSSNQAEFPVLCELKVSNPNYWDCRLPLQMVSNNSTKLIYGVKRPRNNGRYQLSHIHEADRDEIIERFNISKIRETEDNILHCLKVLKDISSSLPENKVYLLSFDGGELKLEVPTDQKYDNCQLRPEVVDSLLQN